MAEIGIGIVGGGYMGKAHAAAYGSVGTLFDTALRPCRGFFPGFLYSQGHAIPGGRGVAQ